MSQDERLLSRKKLRFLHTFWFQFALLTIILVVASILINWGILNARLSNDTRDMLFKEQTQKGTLVANLARSFNIRSNFTQANYAKLQEMLSYIRKQDRDILYVFVRDEDNGIVAQSPNDIVSNDTTSGKLGAINMIPAGQAISHQSITLIQENRHDDVMDTAVQILPGNLAELHVGVRREAGIGSYTRVFELLGIIGVFVLGSIFLVNRMVRSHISEPVTQLTHCINQIGQGNMDYSISLSKENEIGTLGNVLQEMMEQLKGMVQTEADINRMQGQIMNMLSTVSAAADGNLTVEAEVTADALGSLADAFNMMVASLASLVEQVRDSATDMSSATNDILASSDQTIKGAEEQQTHISNITSAVDEIAVSMQQVANNAEAAARASQKATEAAQKGEKSVEETIRGMHRIRNTVQVTSKKIKSLGDRSIEINEIITTIDDIARQTTILALNAAIEAARAGEHGRGFGVVAEEVRKLAERSSRATQDIADLIKGIQAETNEAVRTMEEGTREVEEGTRLADLAGSSLKEIDKSVDQVANLIQEISLAAKQQARGTDGVVRSMETISEITNSHSDGVRRSTKTIEQLAMLSDRLTEAIGNFKIAESGGIRSELVKPRQLSAKAKVQPQQEPRPPQELQQPKPAPKPELQAKPEPQPEPVRPEPEMPPKQAQPDVAQLKSFFNDDEDEDGLITDKDFGFE